MQIYLIKNIQLVNEGVIKTCDVLIKNELIEKIDNNINTSGLNCIEIDGTGRYLLPGVIDDQVHFREPGLTHKATIYTEARAAVAGGVTGFMEMPNTVPPVFNLELLEEKYNIAAAHSLANYSFYIGAGNENADDTLQANKHKDKICGIKVFMGSSTGNLLVDNPLVLEKLFGESEMLIATHCEDERIIKNNLAAYEAAGRQITAADHPLIRNEDACFESSFYAIQLAKKYNSRLHILHISTEKELQLFTNMLPLAEKRITAEVCVHHLHFTADDYGTHTTLIKCNPAIKAPQHKAAIWQALLDDRLDVIATDHAPHTLDEKGYYRNEAGRLQPVTGYNEGKAHSGLPLVQHSLLLMLQYYQQGKITLEKIVQKMSHAVADCFNIRERGYIREGYFADLVIVNMENNTPVHPGNIAYKCGWSPLEMGAGILNGSIEYTFVNGHPVYSNNNGKQQWNESVKGQRLLFNR